ncbi:MAG: NADH-quinone oxidoreductase subunit NuoE [Bauldia litoralis]
MSATISANSFEQPESFVFTPENEKKAEAFIAKYPQDRQASAVLALLDLAQRQSDGWVPQAAIEHIAEMLDMAKIRVLEVASFYSMINLAPVGKYLVQVCGTTPCWLRGSDDVFAAVREELGVGVGETTADGLFTIMEVECLGACVNAPMVQINDDYYEDLTKENFKTVLRALKNGETPKTGSQSGRHTSEPEGGPTTLLDGGTAAASAASAGEDAAEAPAPALTDPARPPKLDAPRDGGADDLKRISGVGPKIEAILNELGIFHFDQVAAWTDDEKTWIDGYLRFKGRIDREGWIDQAKRLSSGEGE